MELINSDWKFRFHSSSVIDRNGRSLHDDTRPFDWWASSSPFADCQPRLSIRGEQERLILSSSFFSVSDNRICEQPLISLALFFCEGQFIGRVQCSGRQRIARVPHCHSLCITCHTKPPPHACIFFQHPIILTMQSARIPGRVQNLPGSIGTLISHSIWIHVPN